MLPKQSRLNKQEVSRVFESGHLLSKTKHFILRIVEGEKSGVSVVVPTKTLTKSVERNHQRRKAYSALKQIPLPRHTLCVLVLLKRVDCTEESLVQELSTLFSKVH